MIQAPGDASSESRVHRFAHTAMATVFEVHCAHDDAAYAAQAAHAAFEVVDRLEQDLSRFRANSDVSRINRLTAGEGTRVSPWTLECLELAQHLYGVTEGAFDVSVGSGLDGLELVADEFTVRARVDGVRLDLGGMGKGYAVDRMAELLCEWGVDRALVHGGFSSVLALEPPPDREGWALTLSSPWRGDDTILARIAARRMALSASGTRKGDHVVEPSTGRGVRGRAAWATLITPRPEGPFDPRLDPRLDNTLDTTLDTTLNGQTSSAALAEGFSTAFMILPVRTVEDICRRCPGLEAWLSLEPPEGGREATVLHLPTSSSGVS